MVLCIWLVGNKGLLVVLVVIDGFDNVRFVYGDRVNIFVGCKL